MNYLRQLKSIDCLWQAEVPSTAAQALYYQLLQLNNACCWKEWFSCLNFTLCQRTNFSINTLIRARKELEELGYIQYVSGHKGKGATKYKIIEHKIDYPSNFEHKNERYCAHSTEQPSEHYSERKPASIYKQNKTKQNYDYENRNFKRANTCKTFTRSYDLEEYERRALFEPLVYDKNAH
jgi:DNA-binding transcriptional MocR family regulator